MAVRGRASDAIRMLLRRADVFMWRASARTAPATAAKCRTDALALYNTALDICGHRGMLRTAGEILALMAARDAPSDARTIASVLNAIASSFQMPALRKTGANRPLSPLPGNDLSPSPSAKAQDQSCNRTFEANAKSMSTTEINLNSTPLENIVIASESDSQNMALFSDHGSMDKMYLNDPNAFVKNALDAGPVDVRDFEQPISGSAAASLALRVYASFARGLQCPLPQNSVSSAIHDTNTASQNASDAPHNVSAQSDNVSNENATADAPSVRIADPSPKDTQSDLRVEPLNNLLKVLRATSSGHLLIPIMSLHRASPNSPATFAMPPPDTLTYTLAVLSACSQPASMRTPDMCKATLALGAALLGEIRPLDAQAVSAALVLIARTTPSPNSSLTAPNAAVKDKIDSRTKGPRTRNANIGAIIVARKIATAQRNLLKSVVLPDASKLSDLHSHTRDALLHTLRRLGCVSESLSFEATVSSRYKKHKR